MTDFSEKVTKVYTAIINRINASISSHNSDSSAHSTEMAKKVDKAQGSSNASKNVVTDSSGNITTESKITNVSDLSNDAGYLTDVSWGQVSSKPFSSVDDSLNTSSTNPVQNSVVATAINGKADSSHTHSDYLPKSKVCYGTSGTAASTSVKVITVNDWDFTTGNVLFVKFTNGNSYNGTMQLSIDGIKKDIVTVGTTKTSRYFWVAGELVCFVYDGTNMVMVEQGTATTTYYGMTKLSSSVISTSETLAATPKAVNVAYSLANGKADAVHTHTVSNISDFPTSHPTTFISNTEEYDNIKTGESTSLTLTNQKLINDAINAKFAALNNALSGNFNIYVCHTFDAATILNEYGEEKIEGYMFKDYIDSGLTNELTDLEENTIYFVLNDSGATYNFFYEFMYINDSTFGISTTELIGSTDIDLTPYVQKSNTAGLIKNDGTIDTNSYLTANDIPSIPSASTTTPIMDGTATIGSASTYAKADHIHPSDTSKADITHEHDYTDIDNVEVVNLKVVYADDTISQLKLLKYTGN